ncbi:MAG: hypothetical protein ACREIV_10965, partial [Planctomycetaceae bacterium]
MPSFDDNVGIRFVELMSGYVRGSGQPLRGPNDEGRFSFELIIEIPLLRAFLDAPLHVAAITGGMVEWKPFVGRTAVRPGNLVLYRKDAENPRRKFYDYDFAFPSGQGFDIRFEGRKVLKDDRRLDAAADMTTVSATLFAGDAAIARGTLNVHIDQLLRQLRFIEVTRSSSAAEESAAREAIFGFFNREIREVYPDVRDLLRDDTRVTAEERRALRHALPVMLPDPMPADGPTLDEVISNLERYVAFAPVDQLEGIRRALQAAAIALPLLDDVLDLRRIAAPELRRRSRSPIRDVLEQLHTLAVFPYYAHAKADAMVGYHRPVHVPHAQPPSALPIAREPP